MATGRLSRRTASSVGLYVIVVVASLVALVPLLWALSTSLKPSAAVMSSPPSWIPTVATFQHYVDVFVKSNFARYLLNSVIVATSATVVVLVVGAHAAYAAARFAFPGRRLFLAVLLVTLMIPLTVLVVPLYLLASNLGVINTYGVLIVVYSAWQLPAGVWLLRGFFEDIPVELAEAASVDGASQWRTFYRIILPLSLPGLAATGIITFVWVWNEFIISLVLTSSDDMRLIPVGLYQFVGAFGTDWGGLTAAALIAILPIIVLFGFLQRYLVTGLTSGGVKG